MKTQATLIGIITAIAALGTSFPAKADSIRAYCKYFPNGSAQAEVSMPCIFSMQQGAIAIKWEDGVRDSFRPISDRPMVYTDSRGGIVYQQLGENEADGTSVRIFKMENGSIYIWGS